jgi:biotin synthase-like enzyme
MCGALILGGNMGMKLKLKASGINMGIGGIIGMGAMG